MIADIYKCPHCGCNVYLAQDEDECPLCNDGNRNNMEPVELGVDLQFDKDCGEYSRYANFKHMAELLRIPYGDRSGLYLMDCWKYAWNPELVDSANIDKVVDFINDPNDTLQGKHKEPMTKEELIEEIERIVELILSKCKFPRNDYEIQENLFSHIKRSPSFNIYVKHDFTYIAAEVFYERTHMTEVLDYMPLEPNRPIPKNKKEYFKFGGRLLIDEFKKKKFRNTGRHIGRYIVRKCFPQPWWTIFTNSFGMGDPTYTVWLSPRKLPFPERLFLPKYLCEN